MHYLIGFRPMNAAQPGTSGINLQARDQFLPHQTLDMSLCISQSENGSLVDSVVCVVVSSMPSQILELLVIVHLCFISNGDCD